MAASPPAYLAIEALARFLEPRLHALTTMLSYSRPSFLPSSWGLSFMKLASVSLLFAGNGLALGIKVGNEVALERRASLIASINLIILLLGGRTNPLVDSAQISLQTYQLLHRCIGIITVAEASLHSGIFLSRHEPLEALEISGLLVCLILAQLRVVPSSWLMRHAGFNRFDPYSPHKPLISLETMAALWKSSSSALSIGSYRVDLARISVKTQPSKGTSAHCLRSVGHNTYIQAVLFIRSSARPRNGGFSQDRRWPDHP